MYNHPMIEARRIFIQARLEELESKVELLRDNEELNSVQIDRIEHKIDSYTNELNNLSMEDADPAAHGYQ